jgi:hypothetical protein
MSDFFSHLGAFSELASIQNYSLYKPKCTFSEYIEKWDDQLKDRLSHLSPKQLWFLSLLLIDLLADIKIETVEFADSEVAKERELFWIEYYIREGVNLTNNCSNTRRIREDIKTEAMKQRFNELWNKNPK